jgi:two-component system response regulator FlrC
VSATVLVVEDDAQLRASLCDTLRLADIEVRAAADGAAALEVLEEAAVDLIVSDVQMAGLDGLGLLRAVKARSRVTPVLLMTAFATVEQAVEAMREGAEDYLIKPFEAEVLVGKVSSLLGASGLEEGALVAVDPTSKELFRLAERVAANEVTVMITGESGSGKEVVARHIHSSSARAGGPFVAINCAAIPDNMLEAVLFGYERGAFTGAHKACPGKFEQAQGGSLLLDEVTEMDLGLQAKLLRVLQEREVERLGAREAITLDVRVLATTNREMREAVAEGSFREDLYYRLNVFPIHLPPLRERALDVVPLAERLLGHAAERSGVAPPRLGEDAKAVLAAHEWPGNVRELDNVVQRALVLADGGVVDAAALGLESAPVAAGAVPVARHGRLGDGLKQREHRLILEALESEGGNRKQAADKLGISPRTLRYKLARMREAGVETPGCRG